MAAKLNKLKERESPVADAILTWLSFWFRWGTGAVLVGVVVGFSLSGLAGFAVVLVIFTFVWSLVFTMQRLPYVRFGRAMIQIWGPFNDPSEAPFIHYAEQVRAMQQSARLRGLDIEPHIDEPDLHLSAEAWAELTLQVFRFSRAVKGELKACAGSDAGSRADLESLNAEVDAARVEYHAVALATLQSANKRLEGIKAPARLAAEFEIAKTAFLNYTVRYGDVDVSADTTDEEADAIRKSFSDEWKALAARWAALYDSYYGVFYRSSNSEARLATPSTE